MPGYDTDFYAWSLDQARRIRALSVPGLDCDHIAEALETLGQGDRHELRSRSADLVTHLLEWQAQSDRQHRSSLDSITEHRHEIGMLLEESPSLTHAFPAILHAAYVDAIRHAGPSLETRCPWAVDQVLDEAWFPD